MANKALHAPIDDDISQLIGESTTAGLKVTGSFPIQVQEYLKDKDFLCIGEN